MIARQWHEDKDGGQEAQRGANCPSSDRVQGIQLQATCRTHDATERPRDVNES